MKQVMIAGALVLLSGCSNGLFTAANVYAMPVDALYQKLDAMEIERSPQAPMGTLTITKNSVPAKFISWAGSGSHAALKCTATLSPVDAQHTKVDTACEGGSVSNGAAAGVATHLVQIAMVEQIDSTLRGRPFDKQKVQMASAGAVMQGLPKMESDALTMQRDVQKDVDAANADIARRHAEAATAPSSEQVPMPGQTGFGQTGQAGQPMADPKGTDPKGTDPTPTSSL